MSQSYILVDKRQNGLATVTLNRPHKHNAFDDAIIQQLTTELVNIDKDDNCRVLMLTASGNSFSAGADLDWMQRMADYDNAQNIADAKQLSQLLKTLSNLSKPTIAVVQGAAIGGGVGLVSCCDIAIASNKAFFCFSEVKIGLSPATISPYVIAAIGKRNAQRFFLTAEKFDAQTAKQINLVHEVVDESNLVETADAIAHKLLGNSPAALAASKKLIKHVANKEIDQSLMDYTSKEIARIRVSDQGQHGLKSFLNKIAPDWAN